MCSPRTLRDVLDSRELDDERRWSILRQALAGLAHIHAQGIIHRDLKVGVGGRVLWVWVWVGGWVGGRSELPSCRELLAVRGDEEAWAAA